MNIVAKRRRRLNTSDGNIVAMLSLKLLLLAFFILLSTMSSFEAERSRAVMESVTTTFEGHITAVRSLPNPAAGLEQLEGAPSLVDQLKSLFKQTLPAVEMETSADGRVLRVEAAASALFRPGDSRLAPGRGVFLNRLARIVQSRRNNEGTYELQFLHSLADMQTRPAAGLAVQRAGAVARRLNGLGLPSEKLAIGLWPRPGAGGRAKVAFEIRLHDAPVPGGSPTDGNPA